MAVEKAPTGGKTARCAASALKAHVGKSARFIGEAAIQIHGGMGTTDELRLGHYCKRLLAIEALFGDTDYHLGRYAASIEQEPGVSEITDAGDEQGGIDYAAFRNQIRAFLEENLTDDLREAGRLSTSVFPDMPRAIAWQKIRHSVGWAAPSWPLEHGGPGWDERQRQIFDEEALRARATNLPRWGVQSFRLKSAGSQGSA